MPKIFDVKDKETGKTIQMIAVDAKEAVDNDPKRYSMKGYSKGAEEPQDKTPTRAKPAQKLSRKTTGRQRAKDADLSETSGDPDKPVNKAAQERLADKAEKGEA
jgi:hypothetical protein